MVNVVFYLIIPDSERSSVARQAIQFCWQVCFFASVDAIGFWFMYSCTGMRTMKRVATWALLWSFIRGSDVWIKYRYQIEWLGLVLETIRVVFYLASWLAPNHWLYRRPAAIGYAKWMIWYTFVHLVAVIIASFDEPEVALCANLGWEWMVLALQPFVLYSTLLQDRLACNQLLPFISTFPLTTVLVCVVTIGVVCLTLMMVTM
jgi:hypothetical protein